jgi:hypothetical protein
MPALTNYEISNLRGRAGRLMKDFIGRTFVLDENAFEKIENQTSLFQDENKSLKSGYGNAFQKYYNEINESIFNNVSNESLISDLGYDFQFLVTYIRTTILKHKGGSYKRLSSVGIELSKEEIKQIYNELTEVLSIPLELCFKNRYIDPLILNSIYENRKFYHLPKSINDYDFADRLNDLVTVVKKDFPGLYKKHFGNRELQINFFYTVSKWAREKPLKEILNGKYFDESDNIDKVIDTIQKDICFNLTTLLKPFYTVNLPDSNLLSCIEMGAYNSITLNLIKLNIPREVSIILKNSIFEKMDLKTDDITDSFIIQTLKKNMDKINFWNQIQLKHLL